MNRRFRHGLYVHARSTARPLGMEGVKTHARTRSVDCILFGADRLVALGQRMA